ncbi:MAG TPA: CHAT domain-containing protein, partial [Vicinamibacterales bacterium]
MTRVTRCLSAFLLAVVAAARLHGQGPAPDDRLAALLAEGQKFYNTSTWDAANAKFNALVELARDRHDELWEARGLSGLGGVAHARSRFDDARRLLSQSLETFERLQSLADVARVERMLGDGAYVAGDLHGARTWYEKSAAAAERSGDEANRIGTARSLIRLDDAEGLATAIDAIAKLSADAKKLGNTGLEAAILHQWSDMLFTRGNYEAAIEKLNVVAQLYESNGRMEDLSTVYNSLGRLFRIHGQPRAALETQQKALAIQEQLDAPYGHVQSLNAVAVSYQALGDAAKARDYYERAIALASRVGLKAWLPLIRGNLGHLLVETDDVAGGRAMIEAAIPDDLPMRQSMRQIELAIADLKLARIDLAHEEAERAMASCPSGERIDCLYARLMRARVQLAEGNLQGALADQRAAVAVLEGMQSTLGASDFLKQGFAAWWVRTYSVAIDLEVRQDDWRTALETAELARARAFVDLIASRQSTTHNVDATSGLTWRGAAAGPITVRSDSSALPSTVAELTAQAARLRTTLLEYWQGENDLYVWVVAPDGTISGARTLVTATRIEQLVRSVGGPMPLTERSKDWRALYDLLIKPIAAHLPSRPGARLTIVPHGPLMQLPFAALRDRRGRYLVERFTIATVPSVAMLRYTSAQRATETRSGSILLVADPSSMPVIAGEPRLPRLPGAVEETRAIAHLMPASRTTWLAAANASEPRVLEAAPHKSVIHFATHAIVRDVDPWSSFLALGVPANGAT